MKKIVPIVTTGKVNYIRYLDDKNNIQTLVTVDKEGRQDSLGVDVRTFRVLQQLENNPDGPIVLKYINDCILDAASSEGDTQSVALVFTIAKVTCNSMDSIRAVYASIDSEVPICLLSKAKLSDSAYRELDAGKYMAVTQKKHHTGFECAAFKHYTDAAAYVNTSIGIAKLVADQARYYNSYTAELAKARALLVEEYANATTSKSFDELGVGLFVFKENTASYSDTTVEFKDADDTKAALQALHSKATNDFQKDLLMLAKSCSSPIKVNGTAVHLENFMDGNGNSRWKVNGKLLSNDDYTEVVDRVTCYPDNQEGYDSFVDLVSKMSLKFHRIVQDGVKLCVSLSNFFSAKYVSHMNLTSGGSVQLLMRKPPRKNLEVFWLGKWRKILTDKQESFVKFANDDSYRYRDGLYYKNRKVDLNNFLRAYENKLDHPKSYNYEYGAFSTEQHVTIKKREEALRMITLVDLYLENEDKVLINEYEPEYKNIKNLVALADSMVDTFKSLIDEAENILKRSKELFDEVCDTPRVRVASMKGKEGYTIQGESGKVYFVDQSTAAVYDNVTGSHICIVNGGVTNTKGYDYLTSVVSALLSDKYTAKAITTLSV